MAIDPLEIDPTNYAKYVLIEDLISGAYINQKVRLFGTVVLNDHQSNKILLEHNHQTIECVLAKGLMDVSEQQMYQMIGIAQPTSSNPIISVSHVRPMSYVEDEIYDTAVQRFNEFVFQ